MKRGLLVCSATVVLLLLFACLVHSPPAFLDAISGATRRGAEQPGELEGSYILCLNTRSEDLKDTGIRELVKALAAGDATADTAVDLEIRISLKKNDPALLNYADQLCRALSENGFQAQVRTYSDVMFRSRLLSGKYDVFLSTRGYLDIELLRDTDYVILDSEEMQARFSGI